MRFPSGMKALADYIHEKGARPGHAMLCWPAYAAPPCGVAVRTLPCSTLSRVTSMPARRRVSVVHPSPPRAPYFVPGIPHILIELRQALVSYQDYHLLLLTLAGR